MRNNCQLKQKIAYVAFGLNVFVVFLSVLDHIVVAANTIIWEIGLLTLALFDIFVR